MKFLVLVLGILALGCLTHANIRHVRLLAIGDTFEESCSESGTYMYIYDAEWDSRGNRCARIYMEKSRKRNVQKLCHGKTSCEFSTNDGEIAHRCPSRNNDRLQVEFECKTCDRTPDIGDFDHEDTPVNNDFDDYGNRRRRVKPKPKYTIITNPSVCNFEYTPPRTTVRPRVCPHGAFVRKHVCSAEGGVCRTHQEVTKFCEDSARIRRDNHWESTNKMSVFAAANIEYESTVLDNGINACVFTDYYIKFDCELIGDKWRCAYKNLVKAAHEAGTGHYMENYDDVKSAAMRY